MLSFIATSTPIFYLIQPLWRDEAFSVLLAQHSVINIIKLTASDFNPPLYYLLLHIWMKLFGTSEISIRSLSFIFHILLVYAVYFITQRLFPKQKNLSILASLLTLTNPMLLYFAFEARMYSLLSLFAALSLYAFITQNWHWYIVFSVLGLYTQPFMILVLLAQAMYYLNFHRKKLRLYLHKLVIIGVFFLPWLFIIFLQLSRGLPGWIEKADFNLLTSALGNLYLGFEGTPVFLWKYTKIVSMAILIVSFVILRLRQNKLYAMLLLYCVYIPLLVSLAFSFIKPIFVNRYVIFITVGEILLIVGYLSTLKVNLQRIMGFILFGASIIFNLWFAPYHKKTDFRTIFLKINKEITLSSDKKVTILAQTPMSFFEVTYYAEDKSKVFLYNPNLTEVLPYLGSILMPKERWLSTIPSGRVYFIRDDATFTKIED